MLGRLGVLTMGVAGAGLLGQGPEVAAQYEQRLGGAVTELSAVIEQFDQDVAQNGLTRTQALNIYQNSEEAFLRDRGLSMKIALSRYDILKAQVAAFKNTNEFYKPVFLIQHADKTVLDGVKQDFSLGLPATVGGLIYGSIGFLLGSLFGGFLRRLARPRSKTMTYRSRS